MRYSEQFMEHIEYAFHAFCKVVLRHEAINAWRDLKRKMEREISLDYLMSERYFGGCKFFCVYGKKSFQ